MRGVPVRPVQVAVALAAAFTVGLIVGRVPFSQKSPDVVRLRRDATATAELALPDSTALLRVSGERVPVQPVSAEPEPPDPDPVADPEPSPPKPPRSTEDQPWLLGASHERLPSSLFEEKYAGVGPDGLLAAYERLNADWRERQNLIFDLRHEAGLYVQREFEPLEPQRGAAHEPGAVGLRLEFRSGDPYVQSREVVLADGRRAAHVVWIPVEEYPDLYADADERSWLWSRVRGLER